MKMTDRQPLDGKIRIAQVIEATTGGTRKHLWLLLTRLQMEYCSLTLIYSNRRDPHFWKDLKQFEEKGVELIEVPMSREINPIQDWISLCKLTKIFANSRYDIVHAHSSKAGFLARLAAICTDIPAVVYAPHCFSFHYVSSKTTAAFYRLLERLASKTGNHLLCVSEGEARSALQNRLVSAEKVHVIPNTIDLAEKRITRTLEEVRRDLGIDPSALVVGTVAQFRPQKGLENLLKLIPSVLRHVPNTIFVFVGDGPLVARIRTLAETLGVEPSIRLVGHQENVWDFYQIMDMFALTSLWEGMPYVLLEASAMGLPLVATDVPGNKELIAHGRNGYLSKPEDQVTMALSIVNLLQNADLRHRMGQESSKMLRERLSIDEWTREYSRLYQKLLLHR